MTGKFITFEGGDGAGKSTQIERLAARLSANGRIVTTTREPGGTPTAEAIRQKILSGSVKSLGADAEAILFAAARTDHVDKVIRPALARDEWILCDRFADSTRVYQGVGGGVDEGLLHALERVAIGDTKPDVTFVLDVPAMVGLARVRERLEATGASADRFEGDNLVVLEKRRHAFLDIAAREPDRCVVVDATQTVEQVAAAIWHAVTTKLLDEEAS